MQDVHDMTKTQVTKGSYSSSETDLRGKCPRNAIYSRLGGPQNRCGHWPCLESKPPLLTQLPGGLMIIKPPFRLEDNIIHNCVRLWTGFVWLRIATTDELLWRWNELWHAWTVLRFLTNWQTISFSRRRLHHRIYLLKASRSKYITAKDSYEGMSVAYRLLTGVHAIFAPYLTSFTHKGNRKRTKTASNPHHFIRTHNRTSRESKGGWEEMGGILTIKYEPIRAPLKDLPPHSRSLHIIRYINIQGLLNLSRNT